MSTPGPGPTASPPERPPLTKVATALPARQRLRREAEALRRAAHPNVVRLVAFVDLADRSELRIEHAGDHSLATASPPDGPAALACAASLAATLADLHELGIVHGRLTPDHVLVAPGGRAVLCGMSFAHHGDPTPDVRAFATLLEVLATGLPSGHARRDRRASATLLAAADRARTGDPAPPISELARQLGARTGTGAPRPARPSRPRRPRRAPLVGAAALAVVLLAVGAVALGDDRELAELARADRPPPTTTAAAPTAPPDAVPPDTVPAETGARAPARFAVGDATYEVGEAGDVVVTGDWDCDGAAGAALLRPDSGELFVFDVLPAPGQPIVGRAVEPVPGAARLEAIEQPNGCHSLVTHGADGQAQVVAVRAP